MKANEYIKENGLAEARKLLEMGRGFVKLSDEGSFHTDELKRLVESHDLVESFGGLGFARQFFDENIECSDSERLKQAIEDVEACQ